MKKNRRYIKATIAIIFFVCAIIVMPAVTYAIPKPVETIEEFTLPEENSSPYSITSGPDGNLWYTGLTSNTIGRVTTLGEATEFQLPTSNSSPYSITSGPDGNLWYTASAVNKVGRITTAGIVTEFTLPTANSSPYGITSGPDGNLWYTGLRVNTIGRITPSGSITEFTLPTSNSFPNSITTGPDGNLWYTAVGSNKIGKISPSGVVIAEYDLPVQGSFPYSITPGPDGNLWYVEYNDGKVGRITPSGAITEFTLPEPNSFPEAVTTGPDGNLWYTAVGTNTIGRMTPSGDILNTYSVPSSINDGALVTAYPAHITTGPDGNIWFSELYTSKMGLIRFIDQVDPTITVNGSDIENRPTVSARPIFSGTATPGAIVTVTVSPGQLGCVAEVDSDSEWSCVVASALTSGFYAVSVAITNSDGSIANLGPYQIYVDSEEAVDVVTVPLAPDTGVAPGNIPVLIVGVLFAIGALGCIYLRR